MSDPGAWIAKKMSESDVVVAARVAVPGLIEVTRKSLPDTCFAYLNLPYVDMEAIRHCYAQHPTVRFILNLPAAGMIGIDAIREAGRLGIAVGKFGAAMSALHEADPADYIDPETKYVERILRQHSRVESIERVDVALYRITRRGLAPVFILVSSDYEVTADSVRAAIDSGAPFDAFVTANPNAQRISPQADAAARSAGRRVYLWRDFMSDLHKPWI